ncbi:MAG: alanine racemase [Victivallales bacterium]|nr:alanine racemase [Victivallales bacterium]
MYPFEVIVDYSIIQANFRALQARGEGVSLACVVKSDAYGHGLVPTSRALLAAGAERLCVFRLEELRSLRDAGVACPVWVLLGPLNGEYEEAVRLSAQTTFAVYADWQARALSQAAVQAGTCVDVHLALDTGMGRLGFLPQDALAAVTRLSALPGLRFKGVFSHIATGSKPTSPITQKQANEFRAVVAQLPAGMTENHLCASEAWLNRVAPELPFARPGIALYAPVIPVGEQTSPTRTAMTVRTRLVSVKSIPSGNPISYNSVRILQRDSVIGVALVGYDDGLPRALSDKGTALVRGQRVPILGTVCMGMLMLDLTDLPHAEVDDEVVLMGRQGTQEIDANEFAASAGTIADEVLCLFGHCRTPRS